jgi:hypothetical protein
MAPAFSPPSSVALCSALRPVERSGEMSGMLRKNRLPGWPVELMGVA